MLKDKSNVVDETENTTNDLLNQTVKSHTEWINDLFNSNQDSIKKKRMGCGWLTLFNVFQGYILI